MRQLAASASSQLEKGVVQNEYYSLLDSPEIIKTSDVLYVTRIQKERFMDTDHATEFDPMHFRITSHILSEAKKS